MNIEDKLKEKVLDSVDFMGEHDLLSVTPFAPLVSLDDAISICKEALKKQRENCAKSYLAERGYNETANSIIANVIKNAPEPEGE